MTKTNTRPEIFVECCAEKRGRYAIDMPWVFSGFLYATDGRICVRMRVEEPDTGGPFPPADQLFATRKSEPERQVDVPALEPRDRGDPCPWCDGEGGTECDKCHNYDECRECRGTGWRRRGDPRRLHTWKGGYALSGDYVELLAKHNARLFIPEEVLHPARFQIGDDIEGLLMPVDISCATTSESAWVPSEDGAPSSPDEWRTARENGRHER